MACHLLPLLGLSEPQLGTTQRPPRGCVTCRTDTGLILWVSSYAPPRNARPLQTRFAPSSFPLTPLFLHQCSWDSGCQLSEKSQEVTLLSWALMAFCLLWFSSRSGIRLSLSLLLSHGKLCLMLSCPTIEPSSPYLLNCSFSSPKGTCPGHQMTKLLFNLRVFTTTLFLSTEKDAMTLHPPPHCPLPPFSALHNVLAASQARGVFSSTPCPCLPGPTLHSIG